MALAREIADRARVARHEDVLAIGLYGSVARGTDNPYKERFVKAIREIIVGELYERVGKLRNARHSGHTACLPELALGMARHGAFLVSLANRHCYSSGTHVLEESLTLPGRPAGYDALCHMTMQGELSDPERIAETCEAFWSGVEQWALERGIQIEESRKIPF